MTPEIHSLRPFIGCRNYTQSRSFYQDIGFGETVIGPKMCVMRMGAFSFYLQDYFVKDWVENTMLFLEVADPEVYRDHLLSLDVVKKYPGVRISGMEYPDWGREFFLHDPSTILWHVGAFK